MLLIIILQLFERELDRDGEERNDSGPDGSKECFGLFKIHPFRCGMLIEDVEAVDSVTENVSLKDLSDRMHLRKLIGISFLLKDGLIIIFSLESGFRLCGGFFGFFRFCFGRLKRFDDMRSARFIGRGKRQGILEILRHSAMRIERFDRGVIDSDLLKLLLFFLFFFDVEIGEDVFLFLRGIELPP